MYKGVKLNKQEKQWIKKNIEQIFITDVVEDNDQQTEHAIEFLVELGHYVGARMTLD